MEKPLLKKRLSWIDALKTFAIAVVVLGHCIQTIDPKHNSNPLLFLIISFQMPLFMAVSGYLSYKPKLKVEFLTSRFVQLIPPFLCWPIIWRIVEMDFAGLEEQYMKLFKQPDTGLWFLYILFLISLLEFIRKKLLDYIIPDSSHSLAWWINLISILALSVTLPALILILNLRGWGIQLISLYYPFYMMGNLMRQHWNKIGHRLKSIGWVLMVLFIISLAVYWGGYTALFNVGSKSLFDYGFKVLTSTLGALSMFSLFSRSQGVEFPRWTYYIGSHTLGIYAVHQPLIGYLRNNIHLPSVPLQICISFMLISAASLLFVYIAQRNKWSAMLLLGEKKMDKSK